jgi:predicted molibdopterin-dependent oxidoreductase YjgC
MTDVRVNGQGLSVPDGSTVLDALRAASVDVPTLCHDPRLKPAGACRLCVVEVRGLPRPVAACTTAVWDGMEVASHTPEIEQSRRALLQLLARKYSAEPAERFPEKEFHRYLRAYGLLGELGSAPRPGVSDDSHPYIHVDMSQCIYCYRCVRICEKYKGNLSGASATAGTPRVSCQTPVPRCLKAPASAAGHVWTPVRQGHWKIRRSSCTASRQNGRKQPAPTAGLAVRCRWEREKTRLSQSGHRSTHPLAKGTFV